MNQTIDKRIEELKEKISVLEWDIHYIRNNRLRTLKEKQLVHYKEELQELSGKNKLTEVID